MSKLHRLHELYLKGQQDAIEATSLEKDASLPMLLAGKATRGIGKAIGGIGSLFRNTGMMGGASKVINKGNQIARSAQKNIYDKGLKLHKSRMGLTNKNLRPAAVKRMYDRKALAKGAYSKKYKLGRHRKTTPIPKPNPIPPTGNYADVTKSLGNLKYNRVDSAYADPSFRANLTRITQPNYAAHPSILGKSLPIKKTQVNRVNTSPIVTPKKVIPTQQQQVGAWIKDNPLLAAGGGILGYKTLQSGGGQPIVVSQ